MKRITSIFIALSLCTLPCFAETSSILSAEINPTLANQNEQKKGKVATLKVKEIEKPEIKKPELKNTGKKVLTKDTLLLEHCEQPKTGNHYGTVSCKENDITIACNSNKSSNTANYSANLYDYSKICPKGNDKISYTIKITDNDDLTTKDVKKITKEYAPQIVCTKTDTNKYGTVTALCTNNKITINCAGKKSPDPITDEIRQNIIKGICPKAKADNNFKLEINESKKATKEANKASRKTQCESNNNGKYDEKKDKCNCNSGYVLDESPGTCVKETLAFTTAKGNLESLGTALKNALKTIEEKKTTQQAQQ